MSLSLTRRLVKGSEMTAAEHDANLDALEGAIDALNASGGGGAVLIDSTALSPIYVGRAPSGSAEGSAVWTIDRSTFNSAGELQSTGTATTVTWTGRTGHTYT